ncbi:MAG: ISLre2 family transposase [Peptococcaceae bacterium MAG4]|nr:ISLre2 family transposase [Peptococcaceae bacterium MAG4]
MFIGPGFGDKKKIKVSPGLSELAVYKGVKGASYREAQEQLESFYQRPVISHETIRQRVLDTGELIFREERCRQEHPAGERRVPILFLEADGIWASLQRESKSKVEKHIIISHEGWQKRSGGGAVEYELVNSKYYTPGEGADPWEYASRLIYSTYELKDTIVVINGDRSQWIRRGLEYFSDAALVLYQMDRFHLIKELRTGLRKQPEKLEEALTALREDDASRLLAALAEAEVREKDQKLKRSIRALRNDILSDPEVVRDYRARLRENGYNISGLRGMGAAESNMDRFANRVKKRGQSWRRYGLQAIISALGKYYEGLLKPYAQQVARLKEKVNALADTAKVSVELAEQVLNNVYHPKQGGLPARKMGRGNSYGLNRFFAQLSRPGIQLS